MSDKALTRYKLLDDVRGEVMGVMPRLVHDFCEGYEMVDADDATHEIERLDARVRELEQAEARLNTQLSSYLREAVEAVEVTGSTWKKAYWTKVDMLDLTGKLAAEFEQERDRLRGLIGALPSHSDGEIEHGCKKLLKDDWPQSVVDALAALLREKQEREK
mgnify:CR=1 FL=1